MNQLSQIILIKGMYFIMEGRIMIMIESVKTKDDVITDLKSEWQQLINKINEVRNKMDQQITYIKLHSEVKTSLKEQERNL